MLSTVEIAFPRELRAALSPSGKRLTLRSNRLNTHVAGEPSESRLLGSVSEIRDILSGTLVSSCRPQTCSSPGSEVILADAGVTEVNRWHP